MNSRACTPTVAIEILREGPKAPTDRLSGGEAAADGEGGLKE
jgi:hypothetical protein